MIYDWTIQDEIKAYNKEIANFYGKEHQLLKAVEECGELVAALVKNDRDNLIEELADVKDMIMQVEHLMGIGLEVQEAQKKKTTRQIGRMMKDKIHRETKRVKFNNYAKMKKGDCQW